MSSIPATVQTSVPIKKELTRLSVLEFLGRDFVSVRRFGRKTRVVTAWLLPPGIRMNRQLAGVLASRIGPLGRALSERLAPVMAQQWWRLTRRQYNTLVLVRELADELSDFEFPRLDLTNRHAVDQLQDIESLFLNLHRDPDYLKTVATALVCVEQADLMGMVLRMLTADGMVPSLYNCILGLNMFKYRRHVRLEQLLPGASPSGQDS